MFYTGGQRLSTHRSGAATSKRQFGLLAWQRGEDGYPLDHGHAAVVRPSESRSHRTPRSTPPKSYRSVSCGTRQLSEIRLASMAASRSMLLVGEDSRSMNPGPLASRTATGAVRSGNLRRWRAWLSALPLSCYRSYPTQAVRGDAHLSGPKMDARSCDDTPPGVAKSASHPSGSPRKQLRVERVAGSSSRLNPGKANSGSIDDGSMRDVRPALATGGIVARSRGAQGAETPYISWSAVDVLSRAQCRSLQ